MPPSGKKRVERHMAYLGITATTARIRTARTGRHPEEILRRQLAALAPDAPVVILVHGYRYNPNRRDQDPQRSLYAVADTRSCRRVRSWPRGLGFSRHRRSGGLCIGFGWPASAPHVQALLFSGRTGFSEVYRNAPRHGARLGQLVNLVQAIAPGRRIDIVAHSLGARVALAALPCINQTPGRIILLGAAEYASVARDFVMRAGFGTPAEIYNITARFNDLYDAMFETFAPRVQGGDHAIGMGIGTDIDGWVDLQLDRRDVIDWINERGVPLRPSIARSCHWSFYTQTGAFEVYRAILARKPGWDIASLRRAGCLAAQDPRWSRIRPAMNRLAGAVRGGIDPENA